MDIQGKIALALLLIISITPTRANTEGVAQGQTLCQNLKEKLPTLSTDQALELLASNGNLIKHPFLISKSETLVGFLPKTWKKLLS